MVQLLLVSHAGLAEGVASALSMLMGPHDSVRAFGMGEGESPEDFRARLAGALADVGEKDATVVLGDIAGGSPLVQAKAALAQAGLGARSVAFGGLNLPMAIAAIMAAEDELDLDAVRDAVLANGADAVREA